MNEQSIVEIAVHRGRTLDQPDLADQAAAPLAFGAWTPIEGLLELPGEAEELIDAASAELGHLDRRRPAPARVEVRRGGRVGTRAAPPPAARPVSPRRAGTPVSAASPPDPGAGGTTTSPHREGALGAPTDAGQLPRDRLASEATYPRGIRDWLASRPSPTGFPATGQPPRERADSSAARSATHSSWLATACQRVARRWPVRRTLPAASISRSSGSTCAGSAFVRSDSAAVLRPSLSLSSR